MHKGERVEELNEPQSNLVSGVFMTVNLYAPPPDVVVASWPQVGRTAVEVYDIASNNQDPAYELRRIPLPRTWVHGPADTKAPTGDSPALVA